RPGRAGPPCARSRNPSPDEDTVPAVAIPDRHPLSPVPRPANPCTARRYIALHYIGSRYSVIRHNREPGGNVTDRLDRWADPPLLVLASLADEPKHGYAITQDVAETMGVRISAGTLYAVIARLEARGLIEPLESDD